MHWGARGALADLRLYSKAIGPGHRPHQIFDHVMGTVDTHAITAVVSLHFWLVISCFKKRENCDLRNVLSFLSSKYGSLTVHQVYLVFTYDA